MKPTVLVAGIVAAVAATCAVVLFTAMHDGMPDDPSTAWRVIGTATVAAIAFVVTYAICARRANKRPVLGAARGTLAALTTFVICIIPYALLFPGTQGRFLSMIAQLLIGGVLFGPVIAGIGAVLGHLVERFILSSPGRAPGEGRS